MKNGDIDPADFRKWTKFSQCLIAVLKILEGTAYRPEVKKTFHPKKLDGVADIYHVPVEDNGTENGIEAENAKIIAGGDIGRV